MQVLPLAAPTGGRGQNQQGHRSFARPRLAIGPQAELCANDRVAVSQRHSEFSTPSYAKWLSRIVSSTRFAADSPRVVVKGLLILHLTLDRGTPASAGEPHGSNVVLSFLGAGVEHHRGRVHVVLGAGAIQKTSGECTGFSDLEQAEAVRAPLITKPKTKRFALPIQRATSRFRHSTALKAPTTSATRVSSVWEFRSANLDFQRLHEETDRQAVVEAAHVQRLLIVERLVRDPQRRCGNRRCGLAGRQVGEHRRRDGEAS